MKTKTKVQRWVYPAVPSGTGAGAISLGEFTPSPDGSLDLTDIIEWKEKHFVTAVAGAITRIYRELKGLEQVCLYFNTGFPRFRVFNILPNVQVTIVPTETGRLRLYRLSKDGEGRVSLSLLEGDYADASAKYLLKEVQPLTPRRVLRLIRRLDAVADYVRRRREGMERFVQNIYRGQRSDLQEVTARIVYSEMAKGGMK